ncbi:MAG: flagellin [Fusobacteriaceae bacterium]|nr:flagellin domain protein [Fusobacteriales bacterium]MDN5305263.1 flagellin [Fusobacteriaceae bacterium]
MRINHNITAMNAYRNLTMTNQRVEKSLERLSSGYRINRAADDAAGLAISEKMRGQINGLKMATKNSEDAISLIQTAEGALNETHAILQRMRELAVQAANDTNTDTDRRQIQQEMNQLRKEIDRITESTEFNTKILLNGDYADNGLIFHIGANKDQTVTLTLNDMSAAALGIAGKIEKEVIKRDEAGNPVLDANGQEVKETQLVDSQDTAISVMSVGEAEIAIKTINDALEKVSDERAKYGAMQNRLEHTINNLKVSAENLQAAESRIRDADMAEEMVKFSKNKIIAQSGTAMLAQANAQPQGVLQLLQG